ncbi:hypothetical protein HBI70_044660 [Parastagonospora nodorum]|nr:hypothetical protein HBH43_125820 [Parastagonospora nodorum]KAH5066573.1 hypothetical protein HBH96_031780 [Parastagonospora nodorum]KAH5284719.1 hypothetical protein HBI70_044660 [Parastagonospora nodorum]KAH5331395.1 hypothetical protein HBI50_054480 [Parastagonospora nodorum]KAH5445994.1 hypothetical protein HBI30_190700 [Parastagonospora nodorum]
MLPKIAFILQEKLNQAPPKGGIIPSTPLKQGADEYLGHPSVLDFRNHDSGSDSELCAHLTAPQRLRISQARPTISPQCMSRPFDFEGQHLPSRLSCRCSSRNASLDRHAFAP